MHVAAYISSDWIRFFKNVYGVLDHVRALSPGCISYDQAITNFTKLDTGKLSMILRKLCICEILQFCFVHSFPKQLFLLTVVKMASCERMNCPMELRIFRPLVY